MKFHIIKNRKYYYTVSVILMVASILSLAIWGLKPGIDFSGGSLLEIDFSIERPSPQEIQDSLSQLDLGDIKVQPAGENGSIIRFKNVDENTHRLILTTLKDSFTPKDDETPIKLEGSEGITIDATTQVLIEQRFESIGPIIGQEIKQKAWIAILLAVIMIIAYITYVFRRVSKPVESWKYGISAIIALIHDILIVTGIFSVLGYFAGVEVDSLFITALLTILGFSINDTIVVFDRTRENLSKHYSSDFEEVVNDSINQTIMRSINTSFTTLLILFALYFFGGATISNFILALIAGVIIGTYSSIFVASPIMVTWHNFSRRKKR